MPVEITLPDSHLGNGHHRWKVTYRSLPAASDEPCSSDAAVGVLPRIISGVALLSVGVMMSWLQNGPCMVINSVGYTDEDDSYPVPGPGHRFEARTG